MFFFKESAEGGGQLSVLQRDEQLRLHPLDKWDRIFLGELISEMSAF